MENHFYPIVELFWKDHYDLGDEWYDDMEDQPPRILSAVGYLVGQDEDYYYVACNYDFGTKQFSAGTAVLKSCVTKRRMLSKGKFDYDQFSGKRTPCEDCKPFIPPGSTGAW
jgi:hypothetical protein